MWMWAWSLLGMTGAAVGQVWEWSKVGHAGEVCLCCGHVICAGKQEEAGYELPLSQTWKV